MKNKILITLTALCRPCPYGRLFCYRLRWRQTPDRGNRTDSGGSHGWNEPQPLTPDGNHDAGGRH